MTILDLHLDLLAVIHDKSEQSIVMDLRLKDLLDKAYALGKKHQHRAENPTQPN